MFNLEKANFIIDKFKFNGCIVVTNRNNCLSPIIIIDSQKS
jgi:hypothetical protein